MQSQFNLDNFLKLTQSESNEGILSEVIFPLNKLIMNYFNSETENILFDASNSLISKAFKETMLIDKEITINQETNEDIRKLFDLINMVLVRYLNSYTKNYSREKLLSLLVRAGGVLSQITLCAYSSEDVTKTIPNDDSSVQNINKLVLESSLYLRNLRTQKDYDPRSILGELKSTIELGVNSILLNEIEYDSESQQTFIDLKKMIILLNAILVLKSMQNALLVDGGLRMGTVISTYSGITLSTELINRFLKYTEATKNSQIRLYDPSMIRMMTKFKEYSGYSPSDFYKYLMSDNKALQTNNLVSLIPNRFINCDLQLGFNLSNEGANNLINDMTINNVKFYEQINKKDKGKTLTAVDLIQDNNYRLFRSPIINCGDYLIASPMTMFEASCKLPLRVLSRQVLPPLPRDINEVGKREFDEAMLTPLRDELAKIGINALINLDLMSDSYFKKLLSGKSDIKKELDMLYVNNGTLYILDLKNYKLQWSFSDIHSVLDRIRSEKKKLRRIKKLILMNKKHFSKMFEGKYDCIELGILTVNLTAFEYFREQDDIKVFSINEFQQSFSQ